MKKDRDCCCNYPVYPAYPVQNMMPGVMPNMTPNYYAGNYNMGGMPNTIEQQLNSMSNQISSLERRVSNLESLIGSNKYNNSNYQML